MSTETQESICSWVDRTFPGGDPESPRKALRLLEEVAELCKASGATQGEVIKATEHAFAGMRLHERRPEPSKIPSEAADGLIVLYGLAGLRGFDLHAEVDLKMKINRERRWEPRGDGTGYHIKESERVEAE